jgi:hypothetical protein
MTENRKENTHNPYLPNIEKEKLASPFQKKKILGLSGACCISSLAEQDFDSPFVGHHFCSHSNARGTMYWGA